jgi:hypothetical protein
MSPPISSAENSTHIKTETQTQTQTKTKTNKYGTRYISHKLIGTAIRASRRWWRWRWSATSVRYAKLADGQRTGR